MTAACVFCEIVARQASAEILFEWPESIAFVPLNPVVKGGHILVIPKCHVQDGFQSPAVTGVTFQRAAELGRTCFPSANLITSIGTAATQSVFHFHVHLNLRTEGDGLPLLWTPQQEALREAERHG